MINLSNQYTPFARKYRPTSFLELHGQEVLVKILSHNIANNRLTQGYLLTGIRGVGKTTSARIIAKHVNCKHLIKEDNNIKSCEQCTSCISFNNQNHPDIIEIDAASKTSVDDIRRIIESAEYKPLLGTYKVFIIDEVHMLSKGAFNALLKTLEEPPAHVIFILATTEVQKVPYTVISRCQRYDLRRLSFEEILILLDQIAKNEGIEIDRNTLRIIASRSEGSARDAISLLDQATSMSIASSGTNAVTRSLIDQMLGLVEVNVIVQFVHYIIDRDVNSAIVLVNKAYDSSANLEIFVESVADFIAYLNKLKLLPEYRLPEYELCNEEIAIILSKTSLAHLSILWQIYSKGTHDVKLSYNQLTEVEMLIIKSIYSLLLPTSWESTQTTTDNLETGEQQNSPNELLKKKVNL